jgi:hypothetical protein
MSQATDSNADSAPPLTPAGLHCIRCDYDLRGQDPAGLCPECATPVQTSLDYPWLSRSEPQWRKRFVHGLLLEALAVIPLYFMLVRGLPRFIRIPTPDPIDAGAVVATAIAWGTASWLITTRDPRAPLNTFSAAAARWLSAILVIGWLPLGLLLAERGGMSTQLRAAAIVATAVALVLQIHRDAFATRIVNRCAARVPVSRFTTFAWVTWSADLAGQFWLVLSALSNLLPFGIPYASYYEPWGLFTWWLSRLAWSLLCLRLLRRLRRLPA